jgi:hypothetical protein
MRDNPTPRKTGIGRKSGGLVADTVVARTTIKSQSSHRASFMKKRKNRSERDSAKVTPSALMAKDCCIKSGDNMRTLVASIPTIYPLVASATLKSLQKRNAMRAP